MRASAIGTEKNHAKAPREPRTPSPEQKKSPGLALLASLASWRVVFVVCLFVAAPAFAQTQNDDDESALLVKEARGKLQKKEYDRAGELLDRAIAVNPRRL